MTLTEVAHLPEGTRLEFQPWRDSRTTIVGTLSGIEAGAVRIMSNIGAYHYVAASAIVQVIS